MATRFSNALRADNSVVANMRAWAQFIEDTLVATGGWVVTGDTGQTPPASLTTPVGVSTKAGYRVYRMADPLQATNPVFMRISFGSGAGGAANPAIWIGIGTGSDGAGNLTGVLWTENAAGTATIACNGSSTSQVTNSYGSANPNRACFALFLSVVGGPTINIVFGIERSKDALGNDTGNGLLIVQGGGIVEGGAQGFLSHSRYLTTTPGIQPSLEVGLSYVITQKNPSETWSPGDVGVGTVIHFRGVSQQPGTNWMITNSSDVSVEGFINMTLYGGTRTYQQLNSIPARKSLRGSVTGINDNGSRILMRYD